MPVSIPALQAVARGEFSTVETIPRYFAGAARTSLRADLRGGAAVLEKHSSTLQRAGDWYMEAARLEPASQLDHMGNASRMYEAAEGVSAAVNGMRAVADGELPRGAVVAEFQGLVDARAAATLALTKHQRMQLPEGMFGVTTDSVAGAPAGDYDAAKSKLMAAVATSPPQSLSSIYSGQGSAAYPTFGSITGATLPAFEAPEWRRIETTPAPFADRARRIGGDLDAMRRMAARVGDVALNSAERNRHAKAAAALLDHVLSDLDVLKLQVGGEVPDADIAKFVTSDVERTHATLLKLRTNTIGVAEGDVVEARFPDQAKFGKAIASWNSARDAIELAAVPAHEPAVAAPAGGMPEVI